MLWSAHGSSWERTATQARGGLAAKARRETGHLAIARFGQ